MRKQRSAPDEKWISLADRAYASIRDGIMTGSYALGSALSRRKLAGELGMSVLPVSEALQRLESEGLVQNKARVGTIIRVPSPSEVRGLFVIREALECQSARLFSEKASMEKREQIAQFAADLDRSWPDAADGATSLQKRMLDYRKRHMALHMKIARAGGCGALAHAIERNQVLVFTSIYDSFLGAEGQPPAKWHTGLLEVLVGTDVEKSESAMRAHVRFGMEMLLSRLEPFLRWDESKLTALIGERGAAGSD